MSIDDTHTSCVVHQHIMLATPDICPVNVYEIHLELHRHFLVDKLEFSKVRDVVAVHVPCSSKKMGIEESFAKLAGLCANEVRPRSRS